MCGCVRSRVLARIAFLLLVRLPCGSLRLVLLRPVESNGREAHGATRGHLRHAQRSRRRSSGGSGGRGGSRHRTQHSRGSEGTGNSERTRDTVGHSGAFAAAVACAVASAPLTRDRCRCRCRCRYQSTMSDRMKAQHTRRRRAARAARCAFRPAASVLPCLLPPPRLCRPSLLPVTASPLLLCTHSPRRHPCSLLHRTPALRRLPLSMCVLCLASAWC